MRHRAVCSATARRLFLGHGVVISLLLLVDSIHCGTSQSEMSTRLMFKQAVVIPWLWFRRPPVVSWPAPDLSHVSPVEYLPRVSRRLVSPVQSPPDSRSTLASSARCVYSASRPHRPLLVCLQVNTVRTKISMIYQWYYNVQCESKKNPPWGLVAIFPKWLGIFQPNFTCLLCIHIYARLRIFIQISASLTKLCHIKRDHPVKIMCAKCPPSVKRHFLTFFPNR